MKAGTSVCAGVALTRRGNMSHQTDGSEDQKPHSRRSDRSIHIVTVGTRVTPGPPHRSRRAALPHRVPTSDVDGQGGRMDRSAESEWLEAIAARSAIFPASDLPVSVRTVCTHAEGLGPRGTRPGLARSALIDVAFCVQ